MAWPLNHEAKPSSLCLVHSIILSCLRTTDVLAASDLTHTIHVAECSPQSFVSLYRFKVNLTEEGAFPFPTHRLHLIPWLQPQTLLESQDSCNNPEGEACLYNLSHLKTTPKSHIGLSVKASATCLAGPAPSPWSSLTKSQSQSLQGHFREHKTSAINPPLPSFEPGRQSLPRSLLTQGSRPGCCLQVSGCNFEI